MVLDVIGIDSMPVVDFLMQVDVLPKTDEFIFAHNPSWQCGGKVPTAVAALGRLGANAGMIGSVGDDRLGTYCIEDFKRCHVDVSHMVIHHGHTTTLSICLAEKSTQGRSFIGVHGSNPPLEPKDIPEDYIKSARYIHLSQMEPAAIYGAKLAKKHGIQVVFDADFYMESTEKNLDLIDVFIASEIFYKKFFNDPELRCLKENCTALRKRGPEIVVITLGAKGSVGIYADTWFESPGFKVAVADTTGAGDVYHGAFLYGLLNRYDIEYTAKFANAVSAIKCTRQGGRAGIPDLGAVNRFLKDGFIDYTDIDKRVEFYQNGIWANTVC
ncbi:ribokinase [Spirochaetia bacterium]|nr:ribokinase [Spirochaetia bacterium]